MNKLENSHQVLLHGSAQLDLPKITNDNLQIIYNDPMVGLDAALHRFIERVESVHSNSPDELNINSPDYIFLTTYGPHDLEPMMDAAVDEYKKIACDAITSIEKLEWFIWLATILTLLFELVFIFLPFDKRLQLCVRKTYTITRRGIAETG